MIQFADLNMKKKIKIMKYIYDMMDVNCASFNNPISNSLLIHTHLNLPTAFNKSKAISSLIPL